MDLTPYELAALTVAGKELKGARGDLEETKSHKIEMTVQLTGFVSVGAPQNRNTKNGPDMERLLAMSMAIAESMMPGAAGLILKNLASRTATINGIRKDARDAQAEGKTEEADALTAKAEALEPTIDQVSGVAGLVRGLTTYTSTQAAGAVGGSIKASKVELVTSAEKAPRKFSK